MIYFLVSKEMPDRVKIGYSANPQQRRKGTTLPRTEIAATMPGDRSIERQLHHRFRKARIGRSEWFWRLPEIEQFIRELNNGSPPIDFLPDAPIVTLADGPTRYWKLAYAAIRAGLLTKKEADLICRSGTRKWGYWAKHCRKLEAFLAPRIVAEAQQLISRMEEMEDG